MSMTRRNRRHLLGLLVAAPAGAVLAGCTRLTDPVVHGTAGGTPPPVPSPDPAFVRAADEVAAVQRLAAGLPTSVGAPWRQGVTTMLSAHLAVITARHPLTGRTSPAPWFTPRAAPGSTPAATAGPAGFPQAAAALAAAHATRSRDAATPALAMLWGSMAVATALHEAPGGPAPVAGPPPGEVAIGSEIAERNVALAHLHSLAQLLEVGIGVNEGEARTPYRNRLAQVRTLVTAQQALVRSLGGDPVGPLPGYDLPGPSVTVADVAGTWTLVEQQVFTTAAPVIGASAPSRRVQAITEMVGQGRVVASRGAATTFFPGWA